MGTVGLALLLAAGRVCTAADHVAPVDLLKHAGSGATTIERDGPQQVRWHLADGQRQVLKVDLAAQGIDPSAYDELRFDIMPEGSQVSLQTALQGFPGERDVTSWYLKFKTTVGRWTPGRYDLRLDDDGIFLSGARTVRLYVCGYHRPQTVRVPDGVAERGAGGPQRTGHGSGADAAGPGPDS